jgi:hypothetical protein
MMFKVLYNEYVTASDVLATDLEVRVRFPALPDFLVSIIEDILEKRK